MTSVRALSEADFQANVIDYAHLCGLVVAHFRPARTTQGWTTPVAADGKGYPDLTIASPTTNRVIFRELKSEKGQLTYDQLMWLSILPDAEVWRPSDWDHIVIELKGLSK